MASEEPLKHLERPPLPWRATEPALTECKLRADSYPTVTREEARAFFRKHGRQRSAFAFCMTCVNTADRWPTWDKNPSGVIARYCRGAWGGSDERIDDELRAIVALIEAHPDEFYDYLDGLANTASLDDQRKRRARG